MSSELAKYEQRILSALPPSAHDAWAANLVRYAATNDKLMLCRDGSVIAALMLGESLGLGLGVGYYIVPRWNNQIRGYEAVYQIGYRGALQIARRGARVTSLRHSIVWKREEEQGRFEIAQHLSPGFSHRPILDAEDTEAMCGIYSTYKVDGEWEGVTWMSTAQLVAFRERYAPRNKNKQIVGPWASRDTAQQMMLKTVLTRSLKTAPLPDEAHHAMLADNTVIDVGERDAEPVSIEAAHDRVRSLVADSTPLLSADAQQSIDVEHGSDSRQAVRVPDEDDDAQNALGV